MTKLSRIVLALLLGSLCVSLSGCADDDDEGGGGVGLCTYLGACNDEGGGGSGDSSDGDTSHVGHDGTDVEH